MHQAVTSHDVLRAIGASPELTSSQIAGKLSSSPVFVQSGSVGVTPTTAGDLSGLLSSSDHIVIAIVAPGSTSDLNQLAKAVSKDLGGNPIVALSRGDETVAYAPSLPSGVANDLMGRAANVSTNPIDTLRTFVGNVHDYQAAHPETVTSTGQPVNPFVPVVGVASGIVGIVLIIAVSIRLYNRRIHSKVKGTAPRDLRPLVNRLMAQQAHIQNRAMRTAIENTCIYVEAYFKRMKLDNRERGVAINRLQRQLESAVDVVNQYVSVQEEERYYTDPKFLLQSGESAMESLSESILEAIRQKNSQQMLRYQVDTQILDAEKYRDIGRDKRR